MMETMVEVQIICTCPSIWIQDLGLEMRKGQSALISKGRADSSKDLVLAQRNKGVEVNYITRFKEIREPQPVEQDFTPSYRQPRPIRTQVKTPTAKVEKMVLDEDALAKRLSDKMGSMRDDRTNALIETLIQQVQDLKGQLANQQPREVVREVVRSEGVVVVDKKDDVPVFIPEIIMTDNSKDVDLKVKETVSDGSVDEATEALRALRRKKKD